MTYRDELTAAVARRDAVRTARRRLVEESPEAMQLRQRAQELGDDHARLRALAAELRAEAGARYANATRLIVTVTVIVAVVISVAMSLMPGRV